MYIIYSFFLLGIISAVLCCKKRIIEFAKQCTNDKVGKLLEFVYTGWRFENTGISKIVFIPMFSSVAILIVLMFIFQQSLTSPHSSLFTEILSTCILSPILEQFFMCGIGLNIFVCVILYALKEKKVITGSIRFSIVKYCGITLGIIGISYWFAQTHAEIYVTNTLMQNLSDFSFETRFIPFMFYSVLYFVNKRNLLPTIMAHSAANIFILLVDNVK